MNSNSKVARKVLAFFETKAPDFFLIVFAFQGSRDTFLRCSDDDCTSTARDRTGATKFTITISPGLVYDVVVQYRLKELKFVVGTGIFIPTEGLSVTFPVFYKDYIAPRLSARIPAEIPLGDVTAQKAFECFRCSETELELFEEHVVEESAFIYKPQDGESIIARNDPGGSIFASFLIEVGGEDSSYWAYYK
jgi:hypothetical protein